MTDLLPCPFCGGPVEFEETQSIFPDRIHGFRKWYGVVCRNTENRGGTCAVSISPSASKEAAIGRWNMRSAQPVQPAAPSTPWDKALEIRMAQGWKLKGDRIPVLYTDTINGKSVGQDNIWLATTAALSQPGRDAITKEQFWEAVRLLIQDQKYRFNEDGSAHRKSWTVVVNLAFDAAIAKGEQP